MLLFGVGLFAAPDMAQIKAAVQQNPALLETPQAQAELKKRGLSTEDVKAKLLDGSASTGESGATAQKAQNDVDFKEVESSQSAVDSKNDLDVHKRGVIRKKINPFAYGQNLDAKLLGIKQNVMSSKYLHRYALNFYKNKNTIDATSLPTPDDYIITTGDVLKVHVYGDRDKVYELKVENDGSVELPFIGPVQIGGMEYKDAKEFLTKKLKRYFKNSQFKINMKKYTTIQVTLVGDVKAPGIYNLSSFSTVKELLIASAGVRPSASVRDVMIIRNGKVIAHLDFYDLLFRGKNMFKTILREGDIVKVQQAKKLVSIDGYVNYAAIFELKEGENLGKLLEYAGGLKPNASKAHIKILRYENNKFVKTFDITYSEAKRFAMQNGDRVYIYPLDFAAKRSINIYGNVIRPGSYELGSAKDLTAFFKKELKNDVQGFFLPETYFEYAVLKRYDDDLSFKTESFNLWDVIKGKKEITLKPNDQIFIFAQDDIFTDKYVITKGDGVLQHPGKYRYFDGMTLQDAINASGLTDRIPDNEVCVTTYDPVTHLPSTIFYSLDEAYKVPLHPYDEIELFDYYTTKPMQTVTISGEVVYPKKVYYEKGMSVADLVSRAGGLKEDAYTKSLEIVRYYIDENQERQRGIIHVDLASESMDDVKLMPYDEVKIFKIPNWNETKTVTLKGEVRFPGTYVIEDGDKLADIIKRAGGFTKEAFVQGAVFTRESIRKEQQANYQRALNQIKRQLAIYNAMPANAAGAMGGGVVSNDAINTLNQVIEEAKKYQPLGRISLKLQKDLGAFEKSPYNITLKDKDSLYIPSQIDTVTVFGEVFNPTSFVYSSDDYESYIRLASGFTRAADDDRVYVIHADGTSEPVESGWFGSSVTIQKGDTIVVPIYIKEYNTLKVADTVAKIFASMAVTVATLNSLGVF